MNITNFITKSWLIINILLFISVGAVFAQSPQNPLLVEVIPCEKANQCNDEILALPNSDFQNTFLPIVTRLLLYGIVIVATIVFFIAGTIYVFSWGAPETVKKAKYIILWGIVGMAFSAAAYLLVKGILNINFT